MTDEDKAGDTGGLSDHQGAVIGVVRIVSSSISIIASTVMVVMILKSLKRRPSTQNRLLVGISCSDIITSIATVFTTLPMPKGTPNTWHALGNITTCEIQGFFRTFGSIATPLYNCGLCIIFLLKIRYNMNDSKIQTEVEPFLHLIAIMVPSIMSVYFLVKDYYNPEIGSCYVSDYPRHCSRSKNEVPCERGDNLNQDFMVWLGYVLFMIISIVIIGSMITLYITVQRQLARIAKFGIGSLTTSSRPPHRSGRDVDKAPKMRGRNQRQQQRKTTRKTRRGDNHSRYLTMTMYRGLAYSLAWFLTFLFPSIRTVRAFVTGIYDDNYHLELLISIFYPLQGLFNFLVYIYPKVMETREQSGGRSTSTGGGSCSCSPCQVLHSVMLLLKFEPNERAHSSMIVRSIQDISNPEKVVNNKEIQLCLSPNYVLNSTTPPITNQDVLPTRIRDEEDQLISEEEKVEIQ